MWQCHMISRFTYEVCFLCIVVYNHHFWSSVFVKLTPITLLAAGVTGWRRHGQFCPNLDKACDFKEWPALIHKKPNDDSTAWYRGNLCSLLLRKCACQKALILDVQQLTPPGKYSVLHECLMKIMPGPFRKNKPLWAVEEKRGNCDVELRNREKKTV